MSSQSIIFIICWRNCACCFKQFGLRDNRNNEGHRSPPCLLSIPLTACADLSSFFKTPFQYGVHTRKIKRAKEFFPIWFSAEAAKKWWVKINKMALHTSVCSVFLIIRFGFHQQLTNTQILVEYPPSPLPPPQGLSKIGNWFATYQLGFLTILCGLCSISIIAKIGSLSQKTSK